MGASFGECLQPKTLYHWVRALKGECDPKDTMWCMVTFSQLGRVSYGLPHWRRLSCLFGCFWALVILSFLYLFFSRPTILHNLATSQLHSWCCCASYVVAWYDHTSIPTCLWLSTNRVASLDVSCKSPMHVSGTLCTYEWRESFVSFGFHSVLLF